MEQTHAATRDPKLINAQLKALLEEENDWIAALANCSAYLNEILEDINWVGFYLMKHGQLVLGPFQGKVACTRIPLGKGVCGTAAETKSTQRIENVHCFPGHIACDSASNSELVCPLIASDEVIGVLDIDSPLIGRFDAVDQSNMELAASLLASHYAKINSAK